MTTASANEALYSEELILSFGFFCGTSTIIYAYIACRIALFEYPLFRIVMLGSPGI